MKTIEFRFGPFRGFAVWLTLLTIFPIEMLTCNQLIPLAGAVVISVLAIVCFFFWRTFPAIILLFLGAFAAGIFAASLDPFLWMWDEQYHALVAKNMAHQPFAPQLLAKPILGYDPFSWVGNHIWLHKQPLFLWQMALSIKAFGLSAFSVRFPSALMHALSSLLVYDIGRRLLNKETGFIAALFFAFNHYTLELIAGRYCTEHNDIAFLFYTAASFWAWLNYRQSGKRTWLVWIGVFSGGAILTKWLVGLLVYAVWVAGIGNEDRKEWFRLKNYYPLLLSLGVTLLVALPWQVYTWYAFPVEARHEFKFNSLHFTEVVEGHSGDRWFHFRAVYELYGHIRFLPYFLLSGFILLLWKIPSRYVLPVLVAVVLPYLFFSLAATKMTSFTLIVLPFGFLSLATIVSVPMSFLHSRWIRNRTIVNILTAGLLITGCYKFLNWPLIKENHSDFKDDRNARHLYLKQLDLSKVVRSQLHGGKWVVFNAAVRDGGHIEVMYFTDAIAYSFVPSSEDIQRVRKAGYRIAIRDDGKLPDFILQDPDIRKIHTHN